MQKVRLLSIILLILTGLMLSAQTRPLPVLKSKGNTITAFIPAGWRLIKQATGDLNQDGIADIAGVIELNKNYNPATETAPPRILFVAFKKPDGFYYLAAQSEKAILKADEGGIWGDPLDSIIIKNKTLTLYFYGGSNHRWSFIYHFRYVNNALYLMDAERVNYFNVTGEGTKINYNLMTGILVKSAIIREKILKTQRMNRGKKLIKLENFNATPDGTLF